jgi:hypothetical protein
MSSSSVEPADSGLRGVPRDEILFYDEYIRVVRESDVEQAVKDAINAEYSADRAGFAKRLLADTPRRCRVPRPLHGELRRKRLHGC